MPLWSRQGRDLFYVSGQRLFVVSIAAQGTFAFNNPTVVPSGPLQFSGATFEPREFDIAPDGTILGLIDAAPTTVAASTPPQIEVVLNWSQELKRLVPTN